jgi:hypothetical protein
MNLRAPHSFIKNNEAEETNSPITRALGLFQGAKKATLVPRI